MTWVGLSSIGLEIGKRCLYIWGFEEVSVGMKNALKKKEEKPHFLGFGLRF